MCDDFEMIDVSDDSTDISFDDAETLGFDDPVSDFSDADFEAIDVSDDSTDVSFDDVETLDFDDPVSDFSDADFEMIDVSDDGTDVSVDDVETLSFDDVETLGFDDPVSDFSDTDFEVTDVSDDSTDMSFDDAEILDFDDSASDFSDTDFEMIDVSGDGTDVSVDDVETLGFDDPVSDFSDADFDATDVSDDSTDISFDDVETLSFDDPVSDFSDADFEATDVSDDSTDISFDDADTTSNDELGQFVDWENEYGDAISDIKNDDSLTDEEKVAMLQSSFDEFNQIGGQEYIDADADTDLGPAKVLTEALNSPDITTVHDDYMSDVAAEIDPISDIENWIDDINPEYDAFNPESPYSNNCGSCAYSVYQRLEGVSGICASPENIGYNDEMETLTGMEQVSMSPEEIEKRLLEQGDGAHAIIGIDRAEGAGHWFNAACLDGKVVAIDGQTGEISDWPPDYGDVVNWEMSVKKGGK